MKLKTLLASVFTVASLSISAQEWQLQLPFHQVKSVCKSNDLMIGMGDNFLVQYDLKDGYTESISKINGMYGGETSSIAYANNIDGYIIGYTDGSFDLYSDDNFFLITDITRKSELINKTIREIQVVDNLAYLCCDFGLVIYDLSKKVTLETTYFTGSNSELFGVNDICFDDQYVWAATDKGVYRIGTEVRNKGNFNNWSREENITSSDYPFNELDLINGQLLVRSDRAGNSVFYLRNEDEEWVYKSSFPSETRKIEVADFVYALLSNEIQYFDTNSLLYKSSIPSSKLGVNDPLFSDFSVGENILHLADYNNGLLSLSNGELKTLSPAGVLYSNAADVEAAGGASVLVSANQKEFSFFDQSSWKVIDPSTNPLLEGVSGFTSVIRNPKNDSQFLLSSANKGLVDFSDGEITEVYNKSNSSLQEVFTAECSVGGVDIDDFGNWWVLNQGVSRAVCYRNSIGEWGSYNISALANKSTLTQIEAVRDGSVWVVSPNFSGMVVFSSDGQSSKSLQVTARFSNSEGTFDTNMSNINCIGSDKEGRLWFGADNGVGYYYSPIDALNNNVYATQPSVDLNDGLYHPLLEAESIMSMCIDAGDRKWFGSADNGVFLVSPDGDHILHHFNTSNSPLPSNRIQQISVDPATGEVYFSTDKGVAIYQGSATRTQETYNEVKVFPNPVRPNFVGDITIEGLVENSEVRITDIAGNLVKKLIPAGGRALWNGYNGNGSRVQTGVYLIFMADAEGNQSLVSKVLFVK